MSSMDRLIVPLIFVSSIVSFSSFIGKPSGFDAHDHDDIAFFVPLPWIMDRYIHRPDLSAGNPQAYRILLGLLFGVWFFW